MTPGLGEKKIQSAQPTEKCPLGDESPFTTNVVVAVVVVVVVCVIQQQQHHHMLHLPSNTMCFVGYKDVFITSKRKSGSHSKNRHLIMF